MSVRVMSKVWDMVDVSGPDLLVLLALADFADDDGRCWPSMIRIAEKTRMTERGARKIIRRLEQRGRLRVDISRGGVGRSSRYQIVINPEQRSPINPEPETRFGVPSSVLNPEPACANPEPACTKPGTVVPPNHQEPSKEPSSSFKRVKPKRASRLPEDWDLSQPLREYAQSKGLAPSEIETEAEKFRNYWHAKAGQAATKLDWSKTWQNWCITAAERKPQRGKPDGKLERILNLADSIDQKRFGPEVGGSGPGEMDNGEGSEPAFPFLPAARTGRDR